MNGQCLKGIYSFLHVLCFWLLVLVFVTTVIMERQVSSGGHDRATVNQAYFSQSGGKAKCCYDILLTLSKSHDDNNNNRRQ